MSAAQDLAPEKTKGTKKFRNIHALRNLPTYRLPLAGWISILHRVSGAALFLAMPLLAWLFEQSIKSEIAFDKLSASLRATSNMSGAGLSGWMLKTVLFLCAVAFLLHFFAGLRHLLLDIKLRLATKSFAMWSALSVLLLVLVLASLLSLRLFR